MDLVWVHHHLTLEEAIMGLQETCRAGDHPRAGDLPHPRPHPDDGVLTTTRSLLCHPLPPTITTMTRTTMTREMIMTRTGTRTITTIISGRFNQRSNSVGLQIQRLVVRIPDKVKNWTRFIRGRTQFPTVIIRA
uniref:Uncharacterized protein n=1 Tax=Cacopsylla melanoneura TaxID=428564 RepID=A0A8D8V3P7_9HEMI